MKKRSLYIIILIIVLVVIGIFIWSSKDQPEQKLQMKYHASLRFGWIPSASFCGEIAGMNLFAQKHNLSLKCVAGGPGLNSVQLVQTGENTFGTIAADEVLAANDKGANFVIIGVINYYSPGAFASFKDKHITTPKDLEGTTVGILPFGSTTLLYKSMLKKNHVDESKIKEITVSSDLKPFLRGAYDVQPVFVYDETVTLDRHGIKYNLIEPKDFGVTLKGPVYFCKRSTLENNPDMVKAFVETMADGWNYAIKHVDSSITMLKAFAPEIDTSREKQVLLKAIPYYTAYKGEPINSDFESWKSEISELEDLDVIKHKVDLNKVIQLQFIHDYYKEKKEN